MPKGIRKATQLEVDALVKSKGFKIQKNPKKFPTSVKIYSGYGELRSFHIGPHSFKIQESSSPRKMGDYRVIHLYLGGKRKILYKDIETESHCYYLILNWLELNGVR